MTEADTQPDEALPGELASLVEPLAVEIHLAWMRAKLIQGWQPGPLDRGLIPTWSLTTSCRSPPRSSTGQPLWRPCADWTGWDIAWPASRAS